MLGFGAFHSAQRFCRAFEELRQYFGPDAKEGNSYQPLETEASLSREYRHLKRCASPPNQQPMKETSGYSSSM